MTSANQEADVISNPLDIYLEEPKKKNKMHQARSEKTAWRSAGEKYDKRPLDPEYAKRYYHKREIIPLACPLCGTVVNRTKMKRHQTGKRCIAVQEFLAKKLQEAEATEQPL